MGNFYFFLENDHKGGPLDDSLIIFYLSIMSFSQIIGLFNLIKLLYLYTQTHFGLVRIPDPWNSSLESGLEFQGSGVATTLVQHTENSMVIPPHTIKVWYHSLQNITSMLFFFQMNSVSTHLTHLEGLMNHPSLLK